MSHGLILLICIDVLMGLAIYLPLSAGDLSVLPIATMAVGAYTYAVSLQHGASLPVAAVEGILLASVAGLLGGLIMLRLPGFSAALASFGLVVVLQTALTNWNYVGGIQGLFSIPDATTNSLYFFITVAVLLVVFVLEFRPIGRTVRAIRLDRLGAECLGVRTGAIRLALYVISAAVSGYAGVLYASLLSYISPTLFGLTSINDYLVAAFLGGSTTVLGPFVGGTLVAGAPTWLAWLSTYRLLVYSLLLIFVLLVRRDGVVTRTGLLMIAGGARKLLPRRGTAVESASRPPAGEQEQRARLAEHEPTRVELVGIRKSFGGVRVLEDVTITAEPGQVTGIVGPNGAGKTTLINIISGVLAADHGEIRLNGRQLRARRPHIAVRRGIARTFQNLRLFGTFTVSDNLDMVTDRPGPYLALVGLAGEEHTRAASLPYGRQRLVEIARAMATRPRVVLLDEPTAGMTVQEAAEVERIISTLRESGVTVLLVEHNMEFVRRICDCVFAIAAGTTIASGQVESVLSDPAVIEAYLGAPTEDASAAAAAPPVEAEAAGTVVTDTVVKGTLGER
jgi:branched-chain amino acid transport system permease protein